MSICMPVENLRMSLRSLKPLARATPSVGPAPQSGPTHAQRPGAIPLLLQHRPICFFFKLTLERGKRERETLIWCSTYSHIHWLLLLYALTGH